MINSTTKASETSAQQIVYKETKKNNQIKIFTAYITEKKQILLPYKRLLKFNKRTNNPLEKWTKIMKKHFIPQEIQMLNKHIKDGQPQTH